MKPSHPREQPKPQAERDEPLFLLDRKPEPMELVIRAICGGILGLLLATYLWVRMGLVEDPTLVVLLYVTVVGGSAFFAAKRGDSYWEGVASFFRRS